MAVAGHRTAVGGQLMTCQLTWHWGSHVAQLKSSIIGGQAFSQDRGPGCVGQTRVCAVVHPGPFGFP